jgi:hypothetical protein
MIESLLAFLGLVVAFVIARAIGALIGADTRGWANRGTDRIVTSALAHLPAEHRDRYRDEWEADLAIKRELGPMTAFAYAAKLRIGARRLASELVPAPQPATSREASRARRDGWRVNSLPSPSAAALGRIRQALHWLPVTAAWISRNIARCVQNLGDFVRTANAFVWNAMSESRRKTLLTFALLLPPVVQLAYLSEELLTVLGAGAGAVLVWIAVELTDRR